MVTRARKARARKSSEASERKPRGEQSLSKVTQFALSSPAKLRLDGLKRDCSQSIKMRALSGKSDHLKRTKTSAKVKIMQLLVNVEMAFLSKGLKDGR